MIALLPGIDDPVTEDPLTAYLAGESPKSATPPWLRLFKLSAKAVFPFDWKHEHGHCPACSASVVMSVDRQLPNVRRTFTLCLNCGRTTSQEPDRPPLVGDTWAPACPAVKQLRRATFGPSLPVIVRVVGN